MRELERGVPQLARTFAQSRHAARGRPGSLADGHGENRGLADHDFGRSVDSADPGGRGVARRARDETEGRHRGAQRTLRVLSADDSRWLAESFGGRAATVVRFLGS